MLDLSPRQMAGLLSVVTLSRGHKITHMNTTLTSTRLKKFHTFMLTLLLFIFFRTIVMHCILIMENELA